MSNVSRAAQMFRDGFACSQAIVGVYGTPPGLPHDQAMRVAAGFAGGMRLAYRSGTVKLYIIAEELREENHRAESQSAKVKEMLA